MSYLYSAAGTKLQVKHTAGAQDEYCDNMVYKNGTLNKILIDEGYIAMEGSAPVYHYYMQDYQGNNRVVIDQNGSVNQVNAYYKTSDGKYYGHEPTRAVTTYKNNADKTIYRSMFDGKEIKIVNIKKERTDEANNKFTGIIYFSDGVRTFFL